MEPFKKKDYNVFEMFDQQWGLAVAGETDDFNGCTISYGSLGTIWGGAGQGRPVVTIYIHPSRYTHEYLTSREKFTVSFFPKEYRSRLMFLGKHSGREGDKMKASGLTPKSVRGTVAFEEAELTFVCQKLYQGQFQQEGLHDEIRTFFYGPVEPHWMFVGEILEVEDKREEE